MELIPGLLQGITRVIVSYPFDYIRTNIQSQEYTSISSYLKNSKLSIKNAYRGVSLPLITVPIDRSIQFLLFERLCKNNSIITSSVLSSLISSIYSVPVNFLSTQIITNHRHTGSVVNYETVRKFISGSAHYTGFRADFAKSFIGAVFYTTIYGSLRANILKENHNYFLFGVLSSLGSWLTIYPIDTIRVIKQTSSANYTQIICNLPIRNMYAGFSIIIARSIPSAGFGMVVYERSKQVLL